MMKQLIRYAHVPYQLVRRPLGLVDELAVQRLSTGNRVRVGYEAGLRAADSIAARLLDQPHPPATASQRRTEVSHDDPGAGLASPAGSERERASAQRRRDFAAKEEQVTRSNRTPATMARDLHRVRAAEEAREHEAAADPAR